MSRLIDASKLLDNLRKHRLTFVSSALDSADVQNATFDYGHKVGYNKGLLAAEQQLEEMLKEEDNARQGRPQGRTNAYG